MKLTDRQSASGISETDLIHIVIPSDTSQSPYGSSYKIEIGDYKPMFMSPDTFVTGGTYSSGTTTFTNNTGGTFSVSGYSTSGGIVDPVSATGSGIVNNVALQELGGVDKLIHGIRVGQGNVVNLSNVVLGIDSLSVNTSGEGNVALGARALKNNTTGDYNSAFGEGALEANTTGSENTAIGNWSLKSNVSGIANTALGIESLNKTLNGAGNTAIGHQSQKETLGNGSANNGAYNTSVGSSTLLANTTGAGNVAIGSAALARLVTGTQNIAIGYQAGNALSGTGNVIIGTTGFVAGGGGVTSGNNNLIIAQNNGQTTGIVTGSGNTVIGKVTGLASGLVNTVILSDGVGTQRLISSGNSLTVLPQQTIALISGDTSGKAIVTKEFLSSSISGITGSSGVEVYVTGGTYSSGTAIFTNNTGGTFSVSGFSTGMTDTYVTGGTYNSGTGIATFTNNSGGTFQVTGFLTTNLQKTITGSSYSITSADNNYSILIDNGATPMTITVPAGLIDKINVGFIQQGTADVTFVTSGTTINTPLPGAFKIKGQYYNAYLEQVGTSNVYQLLGNLKV